MIFWNISIIHIDGWFHQYDGRAIDTAAPIVMKSPGVRVIAHPGTETTTSTSEPG